MLNNRQKKNVNFNFNLLSRISETNKILNRMRGQIYTTTPSTQKGTEGKQKR